MISKKEIFGLIIGFTVGGLCGFFKLPSPAPPVIPGAMLVISITIGHIVCDLWLKKKSKV